jgi:hypothetical protein
VLAFDGVLHRERDAPKSFGFIRPVDGQTAGDGRRAGRRRRPAGTIHASIPMRKRWLVFLDRPDPKMSAGSSPPEARLVGMLQSICHSDRSESGDFQCA